jgi:hypothetical protein
MNCGASQPADADVQCHLVFVSAGKAEPLFSCQTLAECPPVEPLGEILPPLRGLVPFLTPTPGSVPLGGTPPGATFFRA